MKTSRCNQVDGKIFPCGHEIKRHYADSRTYVYFGVFDLSLASLMTVVKQVVGIRIKKVHQPMIPLAVNFVRPTDYYLNSAVQETFMIQKWYFNT